MSLTNEMNDCREYYSCFKDSLGKIEAFRKGVSKFTVIKSPAFTIPPGERFFCRLLWPDWHAALRLAFNYTLCRAAYAMPWSCVKVRLYRLIGMKIASSAHISPGVVIDSAFPELITLEDGSLLGMNSMIATHEMTQDSLRIGRVRVCRGAIVGGNAMLRCGITVGENAVVGLGAVALSDVPPGVTVVGNPARPVEDCREGI